MPCGPHCGSPCISGWGKVNVTQGFGTCSILLGHEVSGVMGASSAFHREYLTWGSSSRPQEDPLMQVPPRAKQGEVILLPFPPSLSISFQCSLSGFSLIRTQSLFMTKPCYYRTQSSQILQALWDPGDAVLSATPPNIPKNQFHKHIS